MQLRNHKQTLYAFGAPLILLIIVCIHTYLVHVYDLTPWKVGGFGMFSTVDSQGARFLRIYLITASGRVPVTAPSDMQPLVREIRTMPVPARLEYLASLLAQATWVPYNYASTDGNSSANDDVTTQDQQSSDDQPLAMVTQGDQPLFRTIKVGEPAANGSAIPVYEVQVELWRFTFDSRKLQIVARKYLEATSRAGVPVD